MMKRIIAIAVGLLVLGSIGWWLFARSSRQSLRFDASTSTSTDTAFSYESYGSALKTFVDERGMVDYSGLKADSQKLDAFAASVGHLDPKIYEAWPQKDKLAFLINAYNALTLEAIIAHYPIESSFAASLLYPKNSIRQIPGAWDRLDFSMLGGKMTLDQIEHDILRKQFNEPRIHLALVCAAMGCPQLRNEPYFGDRLDSQLDDQARRFIADPKKFRLDRSGGVVYLSSIFKWYGSDFVKSFGASDKFAGHNDSERAVLNYLSRYLDATDTEFLAAGKYDIKYLDYDWSLNEQRGE